MRAPVVEPFVHYCQAPGCGAWGAYGYGVRLAKGRPGRWFCAAHRPATDASVESKPVAGTRPADRGGQGRLW